MSSQRAQLNMDILNDWLKVGTMLIVSRLLEVRQDETVQFAERRWLEGALFTLLGFTTYHIVTKQYVTLTHSNEVIRSIINTTLEVGTMLFVSRVLAGQSLDQNWLRSSLYTIAGFAAFPLFP